MLCTPRKGGETTAQKIQVILQFTFDPKSSTLRVLHQRECADKTTALIMQVPASNSSTRSGEKICTPDDAVAAVANGQASMTMTEQAILQWVIKGKSNKEMARLFGRSEGTIDSGMPKQYCWHVYHLLQRF